MPSKRIGSTPTYYLCTPFTKLNEENNPEKDDSAFINDVNSSPSIIGYKNGFAFEAQVHEGDEVVDDLVTIAREQKTGTDTDRYIVDVDMNKEDGVSSGSYYVRKFKVAVECTPPAAIYRTLPRHTPKDWRTGAAFTAFLLNGVKPPMRFSSCPRRQPSTDSAFASIPKKPRFVKRVTII